MVAAVPLKVTGQEYGAAVFRQTGPPLIKVFTIVTPTLSETFSVMVCAPLATVDPLVG